MKSSIPEQAQEVRRELDSSSDVYHFDCVLDGETIGFRSRSTSGALVHEHGIKLGNMHGYFRDWAEDGTLTFESFYVEGREHGVARQWARDGRLIGTYKMDHGTGVDLWRREDGALFEERYYREGKMHGFGRWWRGDNKTLVREGHFKQNIEHGIFREWNEHGRLRRGYSQYFVNGERFRSVGTRMRLHWIRHCLRTGRKTTGQSGSFQLNFLTEIVELTEVAWLSEELDTRFITRSFPSRGEGKK